MEFLIANWPIVVVAVMVLAFILLTRLYSGPVRLPYQARGCLVTKSELKFYRALDKAIQDEFTIFTMVRIADLLRVEKGAPNYRKWLNKILAKHIDFVVCDNSTLQVVVCIELDDRSHQRPDRIERDEFVDAAFESAGLPLLRIPVQKNYPPREIRGLIDSVL